MPIPPYTVQRIRSNGVLYGPIHASHVAVFTLCRMLIDDRWYILSNNGTGKPTCKMCAAAINQEPKD